MLVKYFFLILLLVTTLAIIREKNNHKLIIFYSGFSLIAASLYFYNNAPDVALAEIAVGSAFIPLIFLITISKQRTFTVLNNSNRDISFMNVLIKFCKDENLKLKLINHDDIEDDESTSIHGFFRRQDIDLIIDFNIKKSRYYVLGKDTNLMIKKFEALTHDIHNIKVIRIEDEETDE